MTENTPERQALLKIAAIHHSWELYEAALDDVERSTTGTVYNLRRVLEKIQKDATP